MKYSDDEDDADVPQAKGTSFGDIDTAVKTVKASKADVYKRQGNAVDLVEMVYGICVMGSVNDGDVKFKDLAQAMYQFLSLIHI